MNVEEAGGATRAGGTGVKTLEIKVSLPKMPDTSRITNKLPPAATTKKAKIIGIATGITIVAAFTVSQVFFGGPDNSVSSQGAAGAPRLTKGTPQYKTILPSGKSIESLGGWTRVSPTSSNPVFAYVDQLGPAQLSVSEQPLPDDFKSATSEKVSELAQSFKANEKISAGNTTVYLGSSSEGPQSVIFTRNDLLILIKSSVHIDNNQWAAYITSLR